MSLSSKDINKYLIYIILFFSVFDTARNYTYLPAAFGYIKEIAIVIISFFMFRRKIYFPSGFGIWFGIFWIYFLIISPLGFFNNSIYSILRLLILFIKYVEFFLIFIIFYNLEEIANITYKKCICIYIVMTIILLFVNIIGYYIPNPIVSRTINPRLAQGFYNNRITVGQPPISVYPMILSFVYVLVNGKIGVKKLLILACNVIGVFIAVSSTGIISILGILGYYFLHVFFQLKKKNKYTRKKLNLYILILICCSLAIYVFMSSSNFEVQKKFAAERIGRVLKGTLEKDEALNVRTDNAEIAIGKMSFGQKIFGTGIYGYCSEDIPVNLENTYANLFAMYGLIGLSFFIIMFIKNFLFLFKTVRKNIDNNNIYLTLMLLNIAFLLHAYTLDVIGTITLSSGYAMFYCYMIRELQKRRF
jgi:hypothetical protein